MASPDVIMAAVRRAFAGLAAGPLAGRKVVVTAGGTREAIDAVRYIGNRSSGKMGRAVADEAYLRGADVVLVTRARRRDAVPARRRRERGRHGRRRSTPNPPRRRARHGGRGRRLPSRVGRRGQALAGRLAGAHPALVPTVDILAQIARPGLVRVGFAAEAGPRIDRASAKKAAKSVDLLVFNDILAAGVGIGSDENEITILTPDREVHVPRTSKAACARAILDEVEAVLGGR